MIPVFTSVIASAAGTPPFFAEVTALLVTTALVAYFGQRLGVMPIVSFLLAGARIGPHALGLVQDEALIEAAAEVGVILLLFTIGIEFSLEKLARIKRIILLGGGLQLGGVIAVVAGLLLLAGVDWRSGVFTGCLVALSSTAIVMKLLSARGEMGTSEGQGALGILIFQDLAVVAMVLLIPMLGGTATSGGAVALALGKALGIVALVLVVARRVMPRVLEAVARTCSQEIFLLSVVAICFGTAYLTSLAGVSLSLGAFLAGLVVSESRFSQLAFAEILPLQILFSASFFLSVGLLFDARFLVENVLLVLGLIVAVLVLKLATTGISLLVLGYRAGSAGVAAVLLAQIGEFSFVLERAGREVGLVPAGLTEGGPEAFIATTVALMVMTPFVYPWAEGRLERSGQAPAAGEGSPDDAAPAPSDPSHGPHRDHVIIAGLGEVGARLSHALDGGGVPNVVLTLSPDGAAEAEARGARVIRGNYTRQHEMELAGLRTARMLVVADDDMNTTLQVVETARALNPRLPVIARVGSGGDPMTLREAGATEVVSDPDAVADRVMGRVLASYGVEHQGAGSASGSGRQGVDGPGVGEPAFELTREQLENPKCEHAGQTGSVVPSAPGCETCLDHGKRAWVHLRICMTCGYVGCCDSSPGKHASKHHKTSGHPIMRSMEPGEDWAWCYLDKSYL
jgi:CPA2 family monovalent cation:H+ antiporter-2